MSFRKVQVGNLLSATTHFNDPLVTLNNDVAGSNTSDLGIIMERGTNTNVALLWDESADHFVATITDIRKYSPKTSIEILTPDFLKKMVPCKR